MINQHDIIETVKMIGEHHLDVRTITMGISLLDCVSPSKEETAKRVYEKVVRNANDLVATGEKIAKMYGIPIVNKRVSVTPVSLVGSSSGGYLEIARALDKAAKEIGIDFIGGYSALVQKGATKQENDFLDTIPEALATTEKVCSSVNLASTRAGINMDVCGKVGRLIKETAYLTRDRESIGCAKFVAFANAVEDNPFMAGAFHGVGEADKVINVGVSGPGVVKTALERIGDADLGTVCETIKKTAFKVTRVGQLVAQKASEMLNANFGIVDLSLAPTPVVGDSVAHILEEIGLEQVGACGTTACLALLNDAVKKGGIMASSHVGGLSGAFIPVSEDIGMINAVNSGALSLNKLEAMTAVCSVGLDMIAIPGDTSAEVISALIADEAAIGVVNNKTTAVRVIPAYGKKVGDSVEFGGLLGQAPIMDISTVSPARFINRGGRIAAPVHANKN
ncbi:MAG: PFL family protein [Clostridia bacterium]|nr:PFL family protein [Clostridia bacterium]MBR3685008.1 PFL family protein [Clostridia bacterium]